MHALLTLAYGLLMLAIIQRWRFFTESGISVRFLQGVFLLKFCFGLGLWAIYTYHYTYRDTSDAFRYFDNAMVVFSSLGENPMHYLRLMTGIGLDHPDLQPYFEQINGWTKSYNYGILNDNPTIIRINAFIALFSQGYYHVHTVFMCFFSLMGLTALYRAFRSEVRGRTYSLAIAVFLIPTVLFWGSGVLKEAPLLLFLGMLTWATFRLTRDKTRVKYWVLLTLAFTGMLFLKMYVLIALVPAIMISKVVAWSGEKYISLKALLVLAGSALIALNAGIFFKGGDFLYVLGRKQTDFYNVAELQKAGSVVDIPEVTTVGAFVLNSPISLYNAYFRPDVFEVNGPFYLALSLENLVILLFLIASLISWKWQKDARFMRWFCVSFVVIYGLIVGSTVPILGAIVRYKLPALPFLMAVLMTGGLGGRLEQFLQRRIQGRK